jgi:membrane-bound inhibitor of C-type lysozyme
MNRCKVNIIFGVALCVAGIGTGSSPGFAQTFQSYRCADHTQFIVGFFDHDSRAHLQIDGHAVTLARRFSLSGARYSGSGVTLKIGKEGTTLRHVKRPVTTCGEV